MMPTVLFWANIGTALVVGTKILLGSPSAPVLAGGIIINNGLYRGNNNGAGEFGHTTFWRRQKNAAVGHIGHFEAAASGSAMTKMYFHEMKNIDVPAIEQLVEDDDIVAKKLLRRRATLFAAGIANIIQTLNPEAIILGGGMIRFSYFMNKLTAEIHETWCSMRSNLPPVIRGELDDNANILGAATLLPNLPKQ